MTRFSRGSLLLATSLVLCPAPLAALPITTGTWAATALPTLETAKSEDCATCAALWLLPPGTEQLNGGFGYADWPGAERISHQTEYQDGVLTWDGLSFAYANGHGFASNSWDGAHQQLFRLVAPELTTYWLAIEDLPSPAVWDWNDAVYRWQEPIKSAPPPSVPEPSMWALLATSLVYGSLLKRRMQHGV